MNVFTLESYIKSCFNLFSNWRCAKQFVLILTFFFFGTFLSVSQTFSGSTGAIDDDNCPTTNDFTTTVSGVGVLGTTNFFNEVVVNITHTYTGDLEMTLTAPGGTPSVLLSSGNGGGGNNYTDTHFRLDAIFPITAGTPPFTGDFRPEGNLGLLDGINANGTWTLEICDQFGADIGTLDSWEITFGTEPVEPFICNNPINPSPSCNNFNVVVVLDESGSIDDATEAQVEIASIALANALIDTGAEMAFVEFAESGDIPTYGGFTGWNVVNQAYIDGLNNQSTGLVAQYGDNNNTTGPLTNWEDALNKVLELNVVQVADIVLFMTDGSPTAFINDIDGTIDSSGGTSTALGNALDESCEVKQMGSHIFMLGVGTGIEAGNLAEISGPILDDGPTDPTLTVLSADYGLISAGDITQCFLDIAQSGCNNNLTLEKSVYAGHDDGASCTGEQTISNPSDSKVTYCFTLSNDGEQVISNLVFTDSDIGIDENDLTPSFQTSIAAGQSITYFYEMTFSDGQTFPFLNTAEVFGETPSGDPLSDSSSAEVTESLCEFPSLTTEDLSVCSESNATIDLSTLVTTTGIVSYHTSQLDADNNENALTNPNVSPSTDTIYYVRSEVASDCYVTDIIIINVTEIPELPILECWETATINELTCQWEISGEQPTEPETACYEIATFNSQTCQWVVTGEQPLEPETACYETATFNIQTCQWVVTGEQPVEPVTTCYEVAIFNNELCQWEVSGEQPLEPETACFETATFNNQTCEWVVTGEQPLEPVTACYEIAIFNNELCQWEVSGEQPLEPNTACFETATFNNQLCQWEVSGERPPEPSTACYETARFNRQTCEWEVRGEQPLEPETACYETATFNNQFCQWFVTVELPLEPETACYEIATFNEQLCEWEVTGEQPLQPTLACYETARFNRQTCEWEVRGEQPVEPETACYETATFNNQFCMWFVTGDQPLEPDTACYEIAMFNEQTCEWEVTGKQPVEPETACYELATFNEQTCEWEVTGEQPVEPETACYEVATFNEQTCEWEVTGEQPVEPETACYEIATFNEQTCEWEVTGDQPVEPEIACYELATFNEQTCEWEVTGEQPVEPETACYELATFNEQTCEWEVTGDQPVEPETACYEIATFNEQICEWEVIGEQPLEPETACYEIAIFNEQKCQWVVTGEQPSEPYTTCYESAKFNNQLCEWEISGEQPLEPETTCYEIATFNEELCEWEVTGEQPKEPDTACYEVATFNEEICQWVITGEKPLEPEIACYETVIWDIQLCEWVITGEKPVEPETACYETTVFNYELCQWDIAGIKPMISAETPLCDGNFDTYSVIVNVNIGDVTSSFGNPQDNMDGTWTIMDIPVNNDVIISTSLNENCYDSIVVESPECSSCIELDVSYTNVTCFGLDDGTITIDFVTEGSTITVNGEPYSTNTLYEPGIYTIIASIEDNSNSDCMISEIVTITEPAVVDVQVSSSNVSCYGANDGTITIESLSEGAFYTIKLNGIGIDLSDQDFFAPGTYVVEAKLIEESLTRIGSIGNLSERSQNPCVDAKLVVIEQPNALMCKIDKSFEGTKIECDDRTNNSLTVDVSGGVGSYTFLWSIQESAFDQFWEIQSGNQSQIMTFLPGLDIATFSVEITDENGCSTTCQIALDSTCTEDDNFAGEGRFDFELYPNPSKGNITIIPNKLIDTNVLIEVYDLLGTKYVNQEFSKLKDSGIQIDLSKLDSQVYYVMITTKKGTKIKKVVIDR